MINNLSDIISFNSNFKTAINLYLNLNNKEKIDKYIPTKSSIAILNNYLDAILNNREQASLLIGPYGKGKSHLLLVLLGIVSLERNAENTSYIADFAEKISAIGEFGEEVSKKILSIWGRKRSLPVLVTDSKGDLNQSFLRAMNDALKGFDLDEMVPDTYYSVAIKRIDDWKENYHDTYVEYEKELEKFNYSSKQMIIDLRNYNQDALAVFTEIYPKITAGSEFNPMSVMEVFDVYKSVNEKICRDYDFSGVFIVFDEFSKFIEGQNEKYTGANMKILQDICELATESEKDAAIHITMVAHKSIKEYGKYLAPEIINSFVGIEGRIIERLFITSSKNNYELIRSAIEKDESTLKDIRNVEKYVGAEAMNKFYSLPCFKGNFEKNDFENIVLNGCFPLNPISAYLLLNVSEKVAQNERTLFTFISNDEPYSMARYVKEHTGKEQWCIGAHLIYDYFANIFKKDVTNELVHTEWLNAEYALSRVEDIEDKQVIKTLALFLIVNKIEEMPASLEYLSLASGLDNCHEIVEQLEKKEVLYKKASTNAYVFKTRAGSELKRELKRQRELKGDNVNCASAFLEVTGEYYVVPRKYNSDHFMTRYFSHEYMEIDTFLEISDAEILLSDIGNADGKVISLFGFCKATQKRIAEHVEELKSERLVVVYSKNQFKQLKAVRDYEIVQELKTNNVFIDNNEVLKKELPLLEEDLSNVILDELASLYDSSGIVMTYVDGNVVKLKNTTAETAVNICCEKVFYKSPVINNELINRQVITTGQTKKARLNIIDTVMKHEDDEAYYGGSNQEATLYRSLYVRTGIVAGEVRTDIAEILDVITEYYESCSDEKKSISSLINKLVMPPYGVRKAIIPFYLAYVLASRNEDIVVYFAGAEVAVNAERIVSMCENAEDYDLYVSKSDLQKEKYIESLRELYKVNDSVNLSENRIKDILICMQRWYRALPLVTRNMIDTTLYEDNPELLDALKVVRKILQKVDINSFETLFVDLPKKFGCEGDFFRTYELLDECKTAFDDYYDYIVNKAVDSIYDLFQPNKKGDLYHILKEWYANQSDLSKHGLHSGKITNFMTCVESLNVYDDSGVAKKIVKTVTDIYIENWVDKSLEEFAENLAGIKTEVESIQEQKTDGKYQLTFTGKHGEHTKYYELVDESTGSILRNVIEDTLEEYDDLSVNDRVAILLEMIEKIME